MDHKNLRRTAVMNKKKVTATWQNLAKEILLEEVLRVVAGRATIGETEILIDFNSVRVDPANPSRHPDNRLDAMEKLATACADIGTKQNSAYYTTNFIVAEMRERGYYARLQGGDLFVDLMKSIVPYYPRRLCNGNLFDSSFVVEAEYEDSWITKAQQRRLQIVISLVISLVATLAFAQLL